MFVHKMSSSVIYITKINKWTVTSKDGKRLPVLRIFESFHLKGHEQIQSICQLTANKCQRKKFKKCSGDKIKKTHIFLMWMFLCDKNLVQNERWTLFLRFISFRFVVISNTLLRHQPTNQSKTNEKLWIGQENIRCDVKWL